MKAGQFNINEYLERLNEEAEKNQKQTGFMDGGQGLSNQEGIVIPDTNQKSYQWLKKEFQKGKVEVKVEMHLGDSKFEPGYDLQTDLKSVKDFKPGMFGEVKTAKAEKNVGNKTDEKTPLDKTETKDKTSGKPGFASKDGKKPLPKETESKEHEEKEGEEHEEAESKEHEAKERRGEIKDKEDKTSDKPEVKKIDLKTKKK